MATSLRGTILLGTDIFNNFPEILCLVFHKAVLVEVGTVMPDEHVVRDCVSIEPISEFTECWHNDPADVVLLGGVPFSWLLFVFIIGRAA